MVDDLAEVDPRLLALLTKAGDEWGPLGVALAAARLTDPQVVVGHLSARCEAVFVTPYGERRCDLGTDHEGSHIRNDACGRPEYYWFSS